MKYNVTEVDRELAKSIKTTQGQQIKSVLQVKMAEQETMLDLFEKSIQHCNQQIQLCIDKIAKELAEEQRQKLEKTKLDFEDNKLIWNISGFINLISIDIKTIQIGLYFAETEWHKRLYARQICTIMYESSKDIFELLGKDFKELTSNRIDITAFEHELKNIRCRLNQFQTTHSAYLNLIRNNTAAHKDQDVLRQLDIISSINWTDTIQVTMTFENIINDLGTFLQKLIKSGLCNLENSSFEQNQS